MRVRVRSMCPICCAMYGNSLAHTSEKYLCLFRQKFIIIKRTLINGTDDDYGDGMCHVINMLHRKASLNAIKNCLKVFFYKI